MLSCLRAFALILLLVTIDAFSADDGRTIVVSRECSEGDTATARAVLDSGVGWSEARWRALNDLFACYGAHLLAEKAYRLQGTGQVEKQMTYRINGQNLEVTYIYGKVLHIESSR